MPSLKDFFAKKKQEAKFKLGVLGPGQRLGDATSSASSSSRPSGSRPAEAAAPRKDPTPAQLRAAEAALARSGKAQGQDSFEKKRHQAVIRAQAQKEIEEEKKNESEAARLRDLYGPASASASVQDGPSSLLCSGVFFHCPLLGPEVLPKNEMRLKIKEFLYAQLNEEKGLAACLIIHTINTDKEKVRVCVETLCRYLDNILENPSDEKFRKIRKSNKAFQDRVASVEGHSSFLEAAGFEALVIDNEEFWVLPSSGEADLATLRSLREALVTSEPIRAELDRDTRVLLPAQARQGFDLPHAFFAVSAEEIKREQDTRTDYVERMSMLRTKAMREREEQRERRKYRYALIRIRFPDELVLQGTFSVYEKVSSILEWVSECLEHELPFVLVDAAAGGERLDEVAESALVDVDGLVPSAVLNFAWHPDLADEIAQQTHAFLKEEVRVLVQRF